jgi:hypothetical protein
MNNERTRIGVKIDAEKSAKITLQETAEDREYVFADQACVKGGLGNHWPATVVAHVLLTPCNALPTSNLLCFFFHVPLYASIFLFLCSCL